MEPDLRFGNKYIEVLGELKKKLSNGPVPEYAFKIKLGVQFGSPVLFIEHNTKG
jgi:hypothetical protein